MSKAVWITALSKDEALLQPLMAGLRQYGLAVQGHFWVDDLPKVAWLDVAQQMQAAQAAVWLIVGTPEQWAVPTVRYGLALLAAHARAQGLTPFPCVFAPGDALDPAGLPEAFRGALALSATSPAWQAKVVAKANVPAKLPHRDYRLNVHANPSFGQWFELAPVHGSWDGVIFAVDRGTINFQAVGPAGVLPSRTSNEFPQQGLTLQLGERAFVGWALRNQVGEDASYYVRVEGEPATLLFGAYSEAGDSELMRLDLQ